MQFRHEICTGGVCATYEDEEQATVVMHDKVANGVAFIYRAIPLRHEYLIEGEDFAIGGIADVTEALRKAREYDSLGVDFTLTRRIKRD